jgi:hypothetical protein
VLLGERAGGCGRARDERGDRDGAGGHRARREGWPYPPGRSRPRRCRRCGSRPLLARPRSATSGSLRARGAVRVALQVSRP